MIGACRGRVEGLRPVTQKKLAFMLTGAHFAGFFQAVVIITTLHELSPFSQQKPNSHVFNLLKITTTGLLQIGGRLFEQMSVPLMLVDFVGKIGLLERSIRRTVFFLSLANLKQLWFVGVFTAIRKVLSLSEIRKIGALQ